MGKLVAVTHSTYAYNPVAQRGHFEPKGGNGPYVLVHIAHDLTLMFNSRADIDRFVRSVRRVTKELRDQLPMEVE